MVKCSYCHKDMPNRNDYRILLCMDDWNRLEALANLGEDVLKFYQSGKFDPELRKILEKELGFAQKWQKSMQFIQKEFGDINHV